MINYFVKPNGFMKYYRLLLSAIRRRGILMTARIAYHEIFFDMRYGTETKEYIEAEDIQTESKNKAEGHKYGPLQIPFFRKVFGIKGPVTDRYCYIDFGCGKGRTLFLAALCGFKEVIGIEYSENLCDLCRKNIVSFTKRAHLIRTKFEVIHADATDYAIPNHASTLIFYDPFSAVVFKSVVHNILSSLQRAPRDIWIVVFNYSDDYKAILSQFELVAEYHPDRTLVCRNT